LLDKEISKIRSFYLDKEAELTSNVNVLFDEIAQIESGAIYDSDVEGGGGAGASGYEDGDTDSEGEDGAQRSSMARRSRIVKDAIVNIFSDPKKYNQASREPNRRRFSGSQGSTGGGSTGGGGLLRPENGRNRRVSIISQTSADSDLLGPDEADDDLERYVGKNRGDIPPHTAAVLDKQFEEANGGLTLPPSVPNEVEKPRARFAHSGRSRSVSGAVSSSTTAVATPTGGLRESNSVGKKTRRSLQTDPSRLSVGTFDSDQLRQEVDSGENEDGAAIWNTSDGSPYLQDQRLIARRNIRELYSDLCSLRDYVNLNHTGLRKIIKKWVFGFTVAGPLLSCLFTGY
jgi:phosphate transporter